MSIIQYVEKVQSWLNQGRLVIPDGYQAKVYKDSKGKFQVRICKSNNPNISPKVVIDAISL